MTLRRKKVMTDLVEILVSEILVSENLVDFEKGLEATRISESSQEATQNCGISYSIWWH